LDCLIRLVVFFLETAALRAKNRIDIPISFWKENADRILASNDLKVLIGTGDVSNEKMKEFARKVYDEFDARRRTFEALEADRHDLEELEKVQKNLNKRKK
jgi:hypothetical protein